MEGQGRIQCVLIATTGSSIVYERFYERFTDIEKADIRKSFQQTQTQLTQSNTECIGRFKSVPFIDFTFDTIPCMACDSNKDIVHSRVATTVAVLQGDLVYHAAGTGEYDELACEPTLHPE